MDQGAASIIDDKMTADNDQKLILYWNSFQPSMADDPLVAAKCPETRCIFTNDSTLFDQSDVVLLYANTLDMEDLPTHRFPHQRFVFYAMESQINTRREFLNDSRIRSDYFNWTMTYRRDSDIVLRDIYGGLFLKTDPPEEKSYPWFQRSSMGWLRNKTKMIAWVVSACATSINRAKYVEQLSQYVQVDIYGKCRNLTQRNVDWEMLRRSYKFILVIENTW